jgi:hypothetical protein
VVVKNLGIPHVVREDLHRLVAADLAHLEALST